MICPRCLYRLTKPSTASFRPLSTTTRLLHPASTAPDHSTQTSPRGPPSGTHEGPPAATSTSAAQPFSAPLTPPTPGNATTTTDEAAAPRSSVKAGTVLKGLGYVKGKDGPVAMEDDEYPEWLWGLLDKATGKGESEEEEEGDLYSKSKKQRRLASKRAAELTSSASTQRKIPLEHQSIDLPAGDGTIAGAIAAAEAREQVRVAMRMERRKAIKESNYLKTMR